MALNWLSATDAAAYIGVSPRTLYEWRVGGGKPGRKTPLPVIPYTLDTVGAKYRVADLDEYLRQNPNGPWRPGKR